MKHIFSPLDVAYVNKWRFLFDGTPKTKETFENVIESLKRENSADNHISICQQFLGYCRALYDVGILEKNAFLDIQKDIIWLRNSVEE